MEHFTQQQDPLPSETTLQAIRTMARMYRLMSDKKRKLYYTNWKTKNENEDNGITLFPVGQLSEPSGRYWYAKQQWSWLGTSGRDGRCICTQHLIWLSRYRSYQQDLPKTAWRTSDDRKSWKVCGPNRQGRSHAHVGTRRSMHPSAPHHSGNTCGRDESRRGS